MSHILIVPGLHNSGPQHWQSLWHQQYPHWLRVTGQTWERADLATWSQRVADLLLASDEPLHLVAHSFGSLASIAAAARHPEKIASLFLVAPADPAHFAIADSIASRSHIFTKTACMEYAGQCLQSRLSISVSLGVLLMVCLL